MRYRNHATGRLRAEYRYEIQGATLYHLLAMAGVRFPAFKLLLSEQRSHTRAEDWDSNGSMLELLALLVSHIPTEHRELKASQSECDHFLFSRVVGATPLALAFYFKNFAMAYLLKTIGCNVRTTFDEVTYDPYSPGQMGSIRDHDSIESFEMDAYEKLNVKSLVGCLWHLYSERIVALMVLSSIVWAPRWMVDKYSNPATDFDPLPTRKFEDDFRVDHGLRTDNLGILVHFALERSRTCMAFAWLARYTNSDVVLHIVEYFYVPPEVLAAILVLRDRFDGKGRLLLKVDETSIEPRKEEVSC